MVAGYDNPSRFGVQERAVEVDPSIPGRQLRWSASAVTTFVQCPLKMWWGKVAGWQEGPSVATASGTAVHAALEHLMGREPGERTPAVADAALDHALEETREALAAASVPLDQVRTRSEAALECYWGVENPVAVEVLPNGLERELVATFDDVPFIGYADRLAQSPTGARLTDYKTGAAKPRYFEPYFRQQYLYARALDGELDVTEIELLFLGDGRRVRRPVYPAAVQRAVGTLTRSAAQAEVMAESGRWTARQSALCGWCSFESVCPLRRSRVPVPGSAESDERLAAIPGMVQRQRPPAE